MLLAKKKTLAFYSAPEHWTALHTELRTRSSTWKKKKDVSAQVNFCSVHSKVWYVSAINLIRTQQSEGVRIESAGKKVCQIGRRALPSSSQFETSIPKSKRLTA